MPDIWYWPQRGQWVADVRNPHTRKRTRWYLGRQERQAREAFHARMAQFYAQPVPDGRGEILLADLAARWIEWTSLNRAPATARSRRVYLAWFLGQLGRYPARAVGPEDVEAIKRDRAKKNAPRSVNHAVSCLKSLYRWGLRQGWLTSNPIAHVAGVRNAPHKRLALPDDIVAAILQAADTKAPLGDYLRLLLYTGMRASELIGLPWSAVEGKWLIIEHHKTAGRSGLPRRVPLSDPALAVLERLPRNGDAILSGQDGQAYTYACMRQRWRKLRTAKPRLRGINFHALRHTCCSRLLATGVPEWQVQRILGHASTLMTRYYASSRDDQLLDAVNRPASA